MNYNLITYSIYLPIVAFIMFRVGWLFYKNGAYYILDIIPQNPQLAHTINKMLLIGYYLLNLGYAIVTISNWPTITSMLEMLNTLIEVFGQILLLLGLMHYLNLCWLYLLSLKKSLN